MATRKSSAARSSKRVIGQPRNGQPVYSKAVTSAVYKKKGTKNGKEAMGVPIEFCTLPSPFYTFASKQLSLKNGKAIYVIGCTFTKNNKKLYIVARLHYMGGKPAVSVNGYRGYSKVDAWRVFNNLPYHLLKMNTADGRQVQHKSDGTYRSVIEENQQRRTNYNAQRSGFRSSADGASYRRRY